MVLKPGSQASRFLELLSDGEAHEIREIHEQTGVGRPNSRAADLRRLGFVIESWFETDPRGQRRYFYRLTSSPKPSPPAAVEPVEDAQLELDEVTAIESELMALRSLGPLSDEELDRIDALEARHQKLGGSAAA